MCPHYLKKLVIVIGINMLTGLCHQVGLLSCEVRCLCLASLLKQQAPLP